MEIYHLFKLIIRIKKATVCRLFHDQRLLALRQVVAEKVLLSVCRLYCMVGVKCCDRLVKVSRSASVVTNVYLKKKVYEEVHRWR